MTSRTPHVGASEAAGSMAEAAELAAGLSAEVPPASAGMTLDEARDPRWLRSMTHVVGLLNAGILRVGMVALLASACVLTASVFLRYFLKAATDWQDETAVFLLVGATFLCAACVQQQRGHIGIEAVVGLLSKRVNHWRQALVDLLSLAFCIFFSWKSWTLLAEAVRDGQTTSSSWAPPLWIPYGLMSVGMSLLCVQLLLQFLQRIVRGDAR